MKRTTCNFSRTSSRFQQGSVTVIVVLIIGALVIAGLYYLRPTPKTRPLPPPEVPQVSVLQANPQTYQIMVQTQGTVAPSRQIDLVAEVSGRVVEVGPHFAAGDFFSAGDVLVKLDSRDYQYLVTQADAQVASAKRELALERGQARQARREWRDLGSDEANALFLRKPQINAAQAQLASAVAQQQQARLNLQRTAIESAFDGRIQQTRVNLGQYVTAGSVVASIYDSTLAEVRLPLTDQQVGQIGLPLGSTLTPEQQVAVTLSANVAGTTYQWPARLVRTEATIDSRTRFYFAVAEIPQPFDTARYQSPLIMGLFVEASIAGKSVNDVVRLPEKALIKEQFVYVVHQEKLQQRKITLVDKRQGQVWVQGDLAAGDAIVVSDPNVLQADMTVAIADDNKSGANKVDSSEVGSNKVDSNKVDSNKVDSNKVDDQDAGNKGISNISSSAATSKDS